MIADANLLKDKKYIFYRFSSGKRTNSISNYQIEEIKSGRTDYKNRKYCQKKNSHQKHNKKDNRRKQRWKTRHRTRKKIS